MKAVLSQSKEMEDLFKSLSLHYLKKSIPMVDLSKKKYLELSSYYKRNRQEFIDLSRKYGELIEKNYIIPSTVRPVNDLVGRGLFTELDLMPHDYIGQYCGIVQRASRCKPIADKLGGFGTDYSWTYPIKQGLHALEVNGRVNANELRFVNHSFNANCRMEHTLINNSWILFLVARQVIPAGDQITVDYGEDYWSSGHRTLFIL